MTRMLGAAALGLAMTMMVLVMPALAHHSSAMFDNQKTVTVEGVVKEFQWTNPHSWLLVDVPDQKKKGAVVTWGFEAEGPSTLTRAGIRPSELPIGTKLRISGHPMKDGRTAATWIEAVRLSDGKKFDPRAGFAVK